MNRRVVITGIGAVTPIGTGREGLWQGLRARRSVVGPVTRFDPSPFRSRIAAEVPDFRPADFMDDRRLKRLDRFGQLSIASARLAVAATAAVGARYAGVDLIPVGDEKTEPYFFAKKADARKPELLGASQLAKESNPGLAAAQFIAA